MTLLVATVVFYSSHLLNAGTAERIDASTSILVKTKIGKFTHPAVENVLFVQESAAQKPLLRMVQIRTPSSRGLKQLRGMRLDIVRVRVNPDPLPGGELLSGGYIVEAVVTKGELAKLKKIGFEVSEIPKRN